MIIGLSSQLVKVHYYFAFLNNIICAYNYHTSSPPLHLSPLNRRGSAYISPTNCRDFDSFHHEYLQRNLHPDS